MNIRKIIKEEIDEFDWVRDIPHKMPKIHITYERYMKEYDVVDDYQGLGPGTLFSGDSGYINDYDELVDRLTDDIRYEIDDMNQIEFIELIRRGSESVQPEDFLTTFIKGYEVTWY